MDFFFCRKRKKLKTPFIFVNRLKFPFKSLLGVFLKIEITRD